MMQLIQGHVIVLLVALVDVLLVNKNTLVRRDYKVPPLIILKGGETDDFKS